MIMSVLSVSVMGFQKELDNGVVGEVNYIQFSLRFFEFF